MKSKRMVTVVGALALSIIAGGAVAKQHQISRKIPVDASFEEGAVEWQSAPDSYKFWMKIAVYDGKIEVCGVGVFLNGQYRSATTQILRKRTLIMNGKPILKDFMFFARARNLRKLKTTAANCVSTGVPLPRKEPKFEWAQHGSGLYRID